MRGAETDTDEQRRIIDLPVGARVAVEAPAGTGKTHVLAARLSCLVDRDGLSPGDEVLVLSFSRAAVAELRSRAAVSHSDSRYAAVETFDSFATRLLADAVPNGSWTAGSYDDRIKAATLLLTEHSTPSILSRIRHIFIDEIQDLVEPRAAMVHALLARTNAGWTLFGDSAQAIYGYKSAIEEASPARDSLSRLLEASDSRTLLRMELSRDFRSTTREGRAIAAAGAQLRSATPDQARIAFELRSVILGLDLVTLTSARRMLLRDDARTSALLCRTNGQALRISGHLFDLGVPHALRRRSEDRTAAAWLSRAALDIPTARIGQSALMPHLSAVKDAAGLTADDMFRSLKRLDPQRGGGVDLLRIATLIRHGEVTEELTELAHDAVVVSTIHRAKGLEFDRVLLCPSKDRPDTDLAEENRVLYVALTRARRELFTLAGQSIAGLTRDLSTGRWVRRGFGPQSWRVFELELVGTDSRATHPAGTWLYREDARSIQEYILSHVRAGDPLSLRLHKNGADVPGDAQYLILHGEQTVGSTSDKFATDIRRLIGRRGQPPDRIEGGHVEMIDTVAGDSTAASRSGLGAHGLWARVRVFGLAELIFDDHQRKA